MRHLISSRASNASPGTRLVGRISELRHRGHHRDMSHSVVAVSANLEHSFSKPNRTSIRFIAGVRVEGDAHAGELVPFCSDPHRPPVASMRVVVECGESPTLSRWLTSTNTGRPSAGRQSDTHSSECSQGFILDERRSGREDGWWVHRTCVGARSPSGCVRRFGVVPDLV